MSEVLFHDFTKMFVVDMVLMIANFSRHRGRESSELIKADRQAILVMPVLGKCFFISLMRTR